MRGTSGSEDPNKNYAGKARREQEREAAKREYKEQQRNARKRK